MKRMNFEGRKQQRKESAEERARARANRTAEAQLELLDRRFGSGIGATKERLKLLEVIKERAAHQKQEKQIKKPVPKKKKVLDKKRKKQ